MGKHARSSGFQAFEALNPWPVAMLPRTFKAYQGLSGPGRQMVLQIKQGLAVFPPQAKDFELRFDLNAPVVIARALSEPHLRVSLNAEYHLLRGECLVVHLAEKALGGRHEKRSKKNDRSRA